MSLQKRRFFFHKSLEDLCDFHPPPHFFGLRISNNISNLQTFRILQIAFASVSQRWTKKHLEVQENHVFKGWFTSFTIF